VISFTPWPLYPQEYILPYSLDGKEAEWAPEPVLTLWRREKTCSCRELNPCRPLYSPSLHQLSYSSSFISHSLIPSTKSHIHLLSFRSSIQGIRSGSRLFEHIRNKLIFYGEGLLAPRPTPKLEDHPLSAVRYCLFNIIRSYPPYLEGVSTLRNLRTPHAVVTRDPPNMAFISQHMKILASLGEIRNCIQKRRTENLAHVTDFRLPR
jgi:hypothetical protein